MDSVRCEKYKVYQPELPSKKFPSDEDVSIHNIKVLRGDSGDQNKSTFFEGEIKRKSVPDLEVIEEDQEELGKKIAFGVFRDGVRRIDIVLVLKDDVKALINKIQLDFIVNILRVGLEVELEPGVSKRHKNLTFVKIHAPLHVLEKYGMYFGTKRNFADTRYEYIGRNEKNKERQCLKLMRDGFLNGYSNYERGIIVYKILLHLPFSNYEDDYGVERLLHKYIVADIYALHDGPTYLTSEKTIADINGKKILNDFWIGNLNIFQQQPIHLIHEYFGPTVAFYFSFYECFNKALQLAALASVADIIFGYFNLSSHEKPIEKVMCESRGQICQSCTNNVTCPARPAKEYCFPVKIHLILDHMYVPLFSIFLILGAFVFIRIWKRKEYYLKWMWEVGKRDSYYKKAVRPLYFSGLTKTDNFLKKYIGSLVSLFFRNFVSKIIIILYWYCTLPVMINTFGLYDKFCTYLIKNKIYKEKEKYRDYVLLSIFYTFYIIFNTVLEKAYNFVANFIVKYENYNTYEKHWESLIIKKIGFKLVMHYLFLAYFAWIYGHYMFYGFTQFTYRYLTTNIDDMLKTLYGYNVHFVYNIFTFCFPYSCVIEVGTLLATLILITEVIYKIIQYIFDLISICYSKWIQSRSDIPFWEKEYMLRSISYEDMFMKYMGFASQFAMVLWFVIAFPLAPLVIYLINIIDIKLQARKFLQISRRPLFLKTPVIGWSKVFYFIASFSVITNAINIAMITRTGTRYVMTKYGKKPEELFNYVNYDKNPKLKCYAPDMRTPHGTKGNKPNTPYMFSIDYLLLLMYRYYFVMLFVPAVTSVIFLILYFFPKQREVKVARNVEQKIRQLYKHYEYKNAN